MPDTKTKIATFNRVLEGIERHFKPAIIAIACNTLSSIVEETEYYRKNPNKIISIIDVAVKIFFQTLQDIGNTNIVIFGTETTISSGVYQNYFKNAGIPEKQIIPLTCSKLASEIESDFKGKNTKQIITRCIKAALKQISGRQNKSYIILACTHYGYVANQFSNSFRKEGYNNFEILNPNDYLLNRLFDYIKFNTKPSRLSIAKTDSKAAIKVFSRCRILPEEIDSISKLILPFSTETVNALKNYTLKKDLF